MEHVERLRSVACLAHTIAGVTLLAVTTSGERVTVARHRLDALMDPCQFRSALLAAHRPGCPQIAEVITRCDVVGGLIDLGGGLYQPTHPGSGDTRWFTTHLGPAAVVAATTRCPADIAADVMHVVVKPDAELGVCAVSCAGVDRRPFPQLDEAAFWLLSACMTDEVIAATNSRVMP